LCRRKNCPVRAMVKERPGIEPVSFISSVRNGCGDTTACGSFEMAIAVAPGGYRCDGHVNNVVYVRWVQDVAVAHWRAGPQENSRTRSPGWSCVMRLTTSGPLCRETPSLPAHGWGLRQRRPFERHTEILRNGKVLVRARTLWCPVDIRSGRPLRVPQQVRDQFSVPEADAQSKEQ